VATPDDAELVTRVLVDAFAHDPMWRTWAFPEDHGRDGHRNAVLAPD
jgi:hypothetical protein